MIICCPYIFYGEFQAMAFFPFIFVKANALKKNKILINHEKIHIKQQIELFWIFFFFLYAIEFFCNLIYLQNFHKAYMNISFEKEAYRNESNLNYVVERKPWSFLKYFRR